MATKQDNWRTDVVRCEYCGEDYSLTYKRCPFCDDRASYTNERSGGGKGGKRVATNKRGGGYGRSMEPVQIIGVVLSVILILAAIYIVITVLKPLLDRDEPAVDASQSQVSVSQSDAGISADVSQSTPDVSISGDISAPVIPSVSIDPTIITPIVTATGITLNTKDVTLKANEVLKLSATLTPADCTDAVVWSSGNESALSVAQDGTVTNVNAGQGQVNVTVTAQVGELKATCVVRCKGGSTAGGSTTTPGTGTTTTPTTPATTPVTPSTTVASGTKGTVFGTSTGLRIRSGPGTNYQEQDTALNGAEVTILEQTADGWYKISYSGNGGVTKTGYVSKDYVKTN